MARPIGRRAAIQIESLISHFGLIAVFLGTGLEGEGAALTGGALTHNGLLPFWPTMAVAVAGAYSADLTYFIVSRRFRDHPRLQRLMARPAFAKALVRLNNNPHRFALSFRYVPGLRILGPVALAQSGIETGRFAALALVSASIWGTFYVSLGQGALKGAEVLLGRLEHTPHLIIAAAIGVATLAGGLVARWLWRRNRAG